jgi:hypothetical protein
MSIKTYLGKVEAYVNYGFCSILGENRVFLQKLQFKLSDTLSNTVPVIFDHSTRIFIFQKMECYNENYRNNIFSGHLF